MYQGEVTGDTTRGLVARALSGAIHVKVPCQVRMERMERKENAGLEYGGKIYQRGLVVINKNVSNLRSFS